jgi:hypothetical protein
MRPPARPQLRRCPWQLVTTLTRACLKPLCCDRANVAANMLSRIHPQDSGRAAQRSTPRAAQTTRTAARTTSRRAAQAAPARRRRRRRRAVMRSFRGWRAAPAVSALAAAGAPPLTKQCNDTFVKDCPGLWGNGTQCLICLHKHGADMMSHGCPSTSWPQPVYEALCDSPPVRKRGRGICPLFILKMSFYQDRLGTNTAKTHHKTISRSRRLTARTRTRRRRRATRIPRAPGARRRLCHRAASGSR